jgi:uncharacterized membrane protein YidH (DUF202 family)
MTSTSTTRSDPGKGADATELARTRTALAADRTLMAWIRTSLSMLTFGFGLFKFLHGLSQAKAIQLARPDGPREIGLVLAGLGTVSLVIGLIEYMGARRRMGPPYTHPGLTAYVAGAVLVFAVLVCIAILYRLELF